MKIKTFRIGGVHPADEKLTSGIATVSAPLPRTAVFPLSQHIGAPAKPVVKRGDRVLVGQLLAEAGGCVSAPVHSSVSGVVAKIDAVYDVSGYLKSAISVNVDGDEWMPEIDRTDTLETLDNHPELDANRIIELVKNAGITGMGGAGFPTFVKLMPPPGSKAECVILNGVECEPYITSDYRLMLEHADEIIVGLQLLMKALNVKKGYIAIEMNKPLAIHLFEKKTKKLDGVEVVSLKQRYPQGGEKQLVDAVIRRQVPKPPAIPVNVGAVVQNVSTAFAVYQAVMKHKPLFERYVTVTGKHLAEPSNMLVRMGTSAGFLLNLCGGLPQGDNKVLFGGPMMGKSLMNLDVPVVKGTNCITVLTGNDAHRQPSQPCVRCAKCVNACPMGLEPYLLSALSSCNEWERAENEDIISCIECGSCQYVCPSYRPLLEYIRQGKSTVMAFIKKRNASQGTKK